MAAAFDIITILNKELREFNVPARALASESGISAPRLGSYLNEDIRCPAEHDLLLRETWTKIKRLIALCDPIPIDFSKAGVVRQLIKMMESGELQVVIYSNTNNETNSTTVAHSQEAGR
jgi:hypothetical protein